MVKVVEGSAPVIQIGKQEFILRAEKAGVPLTRAQLDEIRPTAVVCWAWDAWQSGQNVFGGTLWVSHHRSNWCGDWSWIRVHAYYERWGEPIYPGWSDHGVIPGQEGQRYGVNWDRYNSWSQRKFCLVQFFNCVQEAHPYTNVTVWPNGAGNWN